MTHGKPEWPSTMPSLLLKIRELHNHPAWQAFVEIYHPLIFSFCRRRGLQDADAFDVTQEVFSKVSQGIGSFCYEPHKGKFRNWLGTITRHEISNFIQRDDRQRGSAIQVQSLETLVGVPGEVDAEWVEQFNTYVHDTAVLRIRPEFDHDQWQVFVLGWLEDKPSGQVADAMNRDVQWVYKTKNLVLARLKQEIEFLTADIARCSM